MNSTALSRTLAVLALAAVTGFLVAGPLDPAAGPVAPTHKTLTEVEPRIAVSAANTPGDSGSQFRISQPGSYYLTGNIDQEVRRNGIAISASGVTLDLNGFDLRSDPGLGPYSGVTVTVAGLSHITVVNGTVRNWGGDGVNLGSLPASNCRVVGVHVSGNSGTGIRLGDHGLVTDCASIGNAVHGIIAGNDAVLTRCTADQNTGSGLGVGIGSTISDCTSRSNGVYGISAAQGSSVSRCASANNSFHGYFINDGSTVVGCSAYQNAGTGFTFAAGCTVADSTARANSLDGIVVGSGCSVRGNTCSINGNGSSDGAGIHATGNLNRIEGNTCTGADRGIRAIFFGNFIARNTCGGNTTNWDIAAGNVCLVVSGATGASIVGNAGGVAPGSTDPNANFSY